MMQHSCGWCSRNNCTYREWVIEAVDGLDGAAKYKEHKPALVLMDIIMPNADGYREPEANNGIWQKCQGCNVHLYRPGCDHKRCDQDRSERLHNQPFDATKVLDIVAKNLEQVWMNAQNKSAGCGWSALMRKIISDMLTDSPDIEVIARATNGEEA